MTSDGSPSARGMESGSSSVTRSFNLLSICKLQSNKLDFHHTYNHSGSNITHTQHLPDHSEKVCWCSTFVPGLFTLTWLSFTASHMRYQTAQSIINHVHQYQYTILPDSPRPNSCKHQPHILTESECRVYGGWREHGSLLISSHRQHGFLTWLSIRKKKIFLFFT